MPTPPIDKRIEEIRCIGVDTGNYHQCTQGNDLDGLLNHFFEKNSDKRRFPAVDLAAGVGVLTTNFALRYREPAFAATLDWYPTGRKVDTETRRGLQYLAQEAATPAEVLLHDPDEMPICAKEEVVLRGLSAAKFNERRAKVQRKDPEQEGRFAVQLIDGRGRTEKKMISIKGENIFYEPSTPLETTVLKGMSQEMKQIFFHELLDRTCHVDLQKIETWSDIKHLYGKCALVTCINCEEGRRDPQSWQASLTLAYALLTEGGFFVQFDKFQLHGFGNILHMEQYALLDKRMYMIVEQASDSYDTDSGFAMVLWRKVAPGYNRIAEMDRMYKSGDLEKITGFQPNFLEQEKSS